MRLWIWTFQSRYNSIDFGIKRIKCRKFRFRTKLRQEYFSKVGSESRYPADFYDITVKYDEPIAEKCSLHDYENIYLLTGFRMGAFTWILMYFLLIGRCIWIVPAKTLLLYIFICGKRNRPNSIELWPFKSTNCLAGKMKNLKRSFKTAWKVFYLKKWLKINIEVEVVLGIDGDIFTFSPYSNSIISDRRSG